ncbi:hypothetical protein T03_11388 [Trichinella britovi]|uniref:Uncharacterized protein n=1 Tax=Trichinella britovi TaxID=45882 RepID=A0A0V1CWP0_TRIBR|nr:hypothetical protein T03_11388 [Trichinella britovi]
MCLRIRSSISAFSSETLAKPKKRLISGQVAKMIWKSFADARPWCTCFICFQSQRRSFNSPAERLNRRFSLGAKRFCFKVSTFIFETGTHDGREPQEASSLSSAWQGHTSRGTSFSHKAGQRQTRNNEPEMNRQTKEKLIDKFWPIEKSLIEPV